MKEHSLAKSKSNSIAVVCVNLGTPDTPTASAVRRYLRCFLSDRRVVEMPKLLWQPILNGMVLPFRPGSVAKKYRSIWLKDTSPLLFYTEKAAKEAANTLSEQLRSAKFVAPKLQKISTNHSEIDKSIGNPKKSAAISRKEAKATFPAPVAAETFRGVAAEEILVTTAMTYGNPGLEPVLDALIAAGREKILIFPLYPQYSASTVAPIMDIYSRWAMRSRVLPDLRFVRSYPTHPSYIAAVVEAIKAHWQKNGRPDFSAGDKLVLSFHGIPQKMADSGDIYPRECEQSAQAIRDSLGLDSFQAPLTYQSKFGPAPWLLPATIDSVAEWGKNGVSRLDVVCPGFTADCLETLEEIAEQNRDAFIGAGGKDFNYLPWTTDNNWGRKLGEILLEELKNW